MKKNRLCVTIVAMLFLVGLAGTTQAQDSQNIVVHISQYSNNLHATSMGLGLATNLVDKGAVVTVFLDQEGVRLVDKGQPVLVYGDTDTGQLLNEFIVGGGKVLVCDHCAMLAGVSKADLRDGAEMGTKESVAQLFLAADKVVDF